uniref:Dickkopf WNT signaling pathway inhibitor 3b n=1 Tax=Labrus bergylta TaxID=56723 RepID=A0A3Q3H3T1_9LABR
MSGIMFLSVSLSLSLLWVTGGSARSGTVILRDALEGNPVSLNDMFREVEELMEDTQHILEEAVDQITTESAKSSLTSLDLIPNFHNQTKWKNNSTQFFNVHFNVFLAVSFLEDTLCNRCYLSTQECMVDEDCGDLKYCLYEIKDSKCLPCIPTDMPCTKDEECCSEQMCVWGQCTVNATQGTEGTICQGQSDCRPDLCCAFQRELLFPVCNPKPQKGEPCLSNPNLLMDMLAWDQEGPSDHCPCCEHSNNENTDDKINDCLKSYTHADYSL